MKAYIIEELQRRQDINKSLDTTINFYFHSAPGKRVKRGAAQELIMAALELKRTTDLCRLINERMLVAGFQHCTVRGALYYKDCTY